MVVAAEGGEKAGLAHRVEHSGVEFRAADPFAEGAGEGGGIEADVQVGLEAGEAGGVGVFGEGDVEEGDGRGARVKAGGMADPFDLFGLEPGVAEGAVVGRVGVGIEEEEVERCPIGSGMTVQRRSGMTVFDEGSGMTEQRRSGMTALSVTPGSTGGLVYWDFEVGEGAFGVERVDAVFAGGDDGGELGEGEAVFVVMVTVDDGPGAGVGVEAGYYQLHQGVGGGGVEKIAGDCDEVRVGLADEAVHPREDVRDLVGVEELEVQVRELEYPEGTVRAEGEFVGRGGAGFEESQEGKDYDDELFHTAKLTKS